MNADKIVLFLHLPKCGGTTLSNVIYNEVCTDQYGKDDPRHQKGERDLYNRHNFMFHAGVYYFYDFTASGGTIINANIDGPVTIYVENSFTLSGGSSVYQGKAQNLKVIVLNSKSSVTLSGNSDIYVDVYAPLSDITISGTGALYGSILGKTVTLSGRAGVHYDESGSSQVRKIITVK